MAEKKPLAKARIDRMRAEIDAKRRELQEGLPFLYGHKWYWWQRQFFESKNPMRLMTCGNQVGKSSVHQWDKINRATNPALWPELWPSQFALGQRPDLFWYFYTDQDTCSREYHLKWKRWLPQGKYKDHPQYGWEVDADKREKEIRGIKFNSGILLEFKFYTQSARNLQSATVWDIGADEEMPEEFWDELSQRLSAVDGHFSSAFTATLNQQMWWRAMEGKGESELFVDAFKIQVGKRDCIVFEDGSPGLYTEEKIKQQEAMCTTKAQKRRRIDGRFAVEGGRKYEAFDPDHHYVKPREIPHDWIKYSGVDIGSGDKNHPGAFFFIACRPDYRLGYVYKGRRLDDVGTTTAGDVYNFYVAERAGDDMAVQSYDGHCKDFGTIASRNGDPFLPADKSHDLGEAVLNTLFKHNMLFLFDTVEINKLGGEFISLMRDTDKRKAKDDATDATRYAAVQIPWDFSAIQNMPTDAEIAKNQAWKPPTTQEEWIANEIRERRGDVEATEEAGWSEIAEGIDEFHEVSGT